MDQIPYFIFPLSPFPHPALMCAGDAHILAILCDRTASDLDTLRLQNSCELLVGERAGGIFFVNQFFDAAFQNEQRRVAAFRALHAFTEEVAQLEDALRGMGVFAGDGAAHGGRMHADFLGDFFDHHGLELINTFFQKILLTGNDAVADFGYGLLALLDILNQLDGALVAFLHVVAGIFVVGVARDQFFIGRIQAKLGQVIVIHQDQPLIAVLDESDIWFDEAGLALVVLQAGAGIESANVIEGVLNGFIRPSDGLGNFFVLFVLNGSQVLIDDSDGVLQNLRSAIAAFVSIFVERELLLVILQLTQQAFTEVATSYAGRIELTNHLQGFMQI